MRCEEIREWMSEYIDDVLDADRKAQFDEHLADCPDCRSELDAINETVSLLRNVEQEEPPADLLARIHEGIKDAPSARTEKIVHGPWSIFSGSQARVALAASIALAIGVFALRHSAVKPTRQDEAITTGEKKTTADEGRLMTEAEKEAVTSPKRASAEHGRDVMMPETPAPDDKLKNDEDVPPVILEQKKPVAMKLLEGAGTDKVVVEEEVQEQKRESVLSAPAEAKGAIWRDTTPMKKAQKATGRIAPAPSAVKQKSRQDRARTVRRVMAKEADDAVVPTAEAAAAPKLQAGYVSDAKAATKDELSEAKGPFNISIVTDDASAVMEAVKLVASWHMRVQEPRKKVKAGKSVEKVTAERPAVASILIHADVNSAEYTKLIKKLQKLGKIVITKSDDKSVKLGGKQDVITLHITIVDK